MKHRKKWLILGVAMVLLALSGLATSIWMRARSQAMQTKAAPKIEISTEISLQGTLRAKNLVSIPAPIAGTIEIYHVDVGDQVSEGELIAQIRSDALETEKQEGTEAVEAAQARMNNLNDAIATARLEASRASADALRARSELERAAKNHERHQMLVREGAAPRIVADKVERDYLGMQKESKSLDAVAEQTGSRVTALQNELDGARKLLAQKTEELEGSQAELSAGEVHAPATGTVAARRGQPGDAVDRTMMDLMQIAVDLSQMEIVAEPDPASLSRIRAGQPALVRVAEIASEGLNGIVKSVESGKVVVEFANPSPAVRPGLTAQVTIKIT